MAGRAQIIRQSEITRSIKAAHAAGLTVTELVTTREGVRVLTKSAEAAGPDSRNPWDEFLTDVEAE